MAFIQRYSAIKKGGIIFTGNTLGLGKINNANRASVTGSIGAFTSHNTALAVATFPNGTTLDYTQNGSAAVLNIPSGSSVLYAELVWGGLYSSSVNNLSGIIDNPIIFTTPAASYSLVGDPVTRQTFTITLQEGNQVGFYVRSIDVTALIAASGSGTYSVASVPALIEAIDSRTNDTNHAGWTLAVIYQNSSLPFRSLNFWAGGEVVSPVIGVASIILSGFRTPSSSTPSGKIFTSAQEGDAVIGGDQMLFGQDAASLIALSGPNNPVSNFFCSQINDENGLVDTTGTFGTRNANAITGTNISAGRQGYDITVADLTGKIIPDQTSAFVRFISSGDLYLPNAIAIQIENGENPNLAVIKSANKTIAVSGDEIQYSSALTNSGSLPLTGIVFTDDIPAGTTFVSGSVSVNGISQPSYNPATGFPLANLAVGNSTTVEFDVTVN